MPRSTNPTSDLPEKPLVPKEIAAASAEVSEKPSKKLNVPSADSYATTYSLLDAQRNMVDQLSITDYKLLESYVYHLLSEDSYPEYNAPAEAISSNMLHFLDKSSARKVKLISETGDQEFDGSTKQSELEAFFLEYSWSFFNFLVDGQESKVEADRSLVINIEKIAAAGEIAIKLVEMMDAQNSNPLQIQQFKVLFNGSKFCRRLPMEKVVVYYKKGVEGLEPPFFDSNGMAIAKALAPFMQKGAGSTAQFPFLEAVPDVTGAAWGAESKSNPNLGFAVFRSNSIAEMLVANGGLQADAAAFQSDLEAFFLSDGISPGQPHLNA